MQKTSRTGGQSWRDDMEKRRNPNKGKSKAISDEDEDEEESTKSGDEAVLEELEALYKMWKDTQK